MHQDVFFSLTSQQGEKTVGLFLGLVLRKAMIRDTWSHNFYLQCFDNCWLDVRKSIQPVKS